MSETVFSEWVDIPKHAGAYWMRHNATKLFIICQVAKEEGGYWIMRPGLQGGMNTDKLRPGELSFFGPLCLPNGTAYISKEAVYREEDLPVEPI